MDFAEGVASALLIKGESMEQLYGYGIWIVIALGALGIGLAIMVW